MTCTLDSLKSAARWTYGRRQLSESSAAIVIMKTFCRCRENNERELRARLHVGSQLTANEGRCMSVLSKLLKALEPVDQDIAKRIVQAVESAVENLGSSRSPRVSSSLGSIPWK
jgi:hypothetical protein